MSLQDIIQTLTKQQKTWLFIQEGGKGSLVGALFGTYLIPLMTNVSVSIIWSLVSSLLYVVRSTQNLKKHAV